MTDKPDLITSITMTINWADQGGVALMAGDQLIKACETEEQLSAFLAGFLKTLRGQARHITIPIEDHNALIESRDKLRRMERQGSGTRGMAQRLKPELAVEPRTEEIEPDEDENVEKLSKWKSALGFGGGRQ